MRVSYGQTMDTEKSVGARNRTLLVVIFAWWEQALVDSCWGGPSSRLGDSFVSLTSLNSRVWLYYEYVDPNSTGKHESADGTNLSLTFQKNQR